MFMIMMMIVIMIVMMVVMMVVVVIMVMVVINVFAFFFLTAYHDFHMSSFDSAFYGLFLFKAYSRKGRLGKPGKKLFLFILGKQFKQCCHQHIPCGSHVTFNIKYFH